MTAPDDGLSFDVPPGSVAVCRRDANRLNNLYWRPCATVAATPHFHDTHTLQLGQYGQSTLYRLPRHRMGRALPRREPAVRDAQPGRRAGGTELEIGRASCRE